MIGVSMYSLALFYNCAQSQSYTHMW